jgi:hypothetical protein
MSLTKYEAKPLPVPPPEVVWAIQVSTAFAGVQASDWLVIHDDGLIEDLTDALFNEKYQPYVGGA